MKLGVIQKPAASVCIISTNRCYTERYVAFKAHKVDATMAQSTFSPSFVLLTCANHEAIFEMNRGVRLASVSFWWTKNSMCVWRGSV